MHEETVATVPDYGEADLGDGEPARLLNKRNTARLLGGISEKEVERRIKAGELESVSLGRRCLVVMSSVDAYVARLRREAAERTAAVST